MPDKPTTKGNRVALRRLECLRDDCRRHDAAPVKLEMLLEEREGRAPISTIALRGPDSEVEKAKAFLDRFGELLTAQPELWAPLGVRPFEAPPGWDSRREAAKYALIERAPALIVCEVRASLLPQEVDADAARGYLDSLPPTATDRCRTVPDVRLAIAEAIDAVLGNAEGRRRRTKKEVAEDIANKLAAALVAIGKDPGATDLAIASAIGVAASWYSRNLSTHEFVVRARSAGVCIPAASKGVAQELTQSGARARVRKSS